MARREERGWEGRQGWERCRRPGLGQGGVADLGVGEVAGVADVRVAGIEESVQNKLECKQEQEQEQ